MDKKDGILLFIGAGLEAIGWGAGMIEHITPIVGYAVVGLGILVVVYAGIRYFRYKPIYPKWQELKARGDEKRYYLEPLQNTVDMTTKRCEELFKEAVNSNAKYLKDSGKEGIASAAKKIGRFLLDNPYYSELKKSDTMTELRRTYEALHSHIKDKRLKGYLIKLWKCEHQAKSVLIFYETLRMSYGDVPERLVRIYGREETPLKEYQDALDRVYQRIDELLGGVPDE
ncbi:hypothetical protein ACFLWO_03390 [Chloroflexota bacterium]